MAIFIAVGVCVIVGGGSAFVTAQILGNNARQQLDQAASPLGFVVGGAAVVLAGIGILYTASSASTPSLSARQWWILVGVGVLVAAGSATAGSRGMVWLDRDAAGETSSLAGASVPESAGADPYEVQLSIWSQACGKKLSEMDRVPDAQSGEYKFRATCSVIVANGTKVEINIMEYSGGSAASRRPKNDKSESDAGQAYVTGAQTGSWIGPHGVHGVSVRYVLHDPVIGSSAKYWLEVSDSTVVVTAQVNVGERDTRERDFDAVLAALRLRQYQLK